jgi:hypothetical protein
LHDIVAGCRKIPHQAADSRTRIVQSVDRT